jgi:nuclear pore complex protein Nup85
MRTVLEGIPIDNSLLDDSIQSSLCRGEIIPALQSCHKMDAWLAAHLGDVFDKLALIPDDEERFDSSLRDYFILDYTDTLDGNPKHAALWRITADYLFAAGEEGRVRLRSHILHTALGDGSGRAKGKGKEVVAQGGMDVEGGEDSGDKRFEHFTDLRECCLELRLEEEWKMISKVMADRLVRNGEYGLGATMCFQAEDGEGLSRIAERIVDVYVQEGEPSAECEPG